MADNLATILLTNHLLTGEEASSDELQLRVDQVLLQDATGTMAALEYLELSDERIKVPLAVQYVDHNTIQLDFKNHDDHRFLQDFCAKHGIHYSRPGNGICHYLHIERFAKPGEFLIGSDSHTTTSGSLGMLAIGVGGLEAAVALAGEPFSLGKPAIVGVELTGHLKPWVQAKDVILELLRRRGVRGGIGRIFEFYGDGVRTLNVTQRATICNMIAELGATTAIFPSDERTREWLEAQRRPDHWRPLAAEPGAAYDEYEIVHLDALEPLIAKPSSPGNVVPIREIAGTPVGQVCVGSSVNSGYEDLAIVGEVLRGKTIAPGLSMTVTPGSRQILKTITRSGTYDSLIESGARMLEPVCGPCVGMGQAPATGIVSVRTFNRNFPGRSGTSGDQVFLTSPATAAATALSGVITDPRDLGQAEPVIEPPIRFPEIDDSQILMPLAAEKAASIKLTFGPNIHRPPRQEALPESLSGRVLIVLGDDISTGDLSPDGAEVMAFRSNIPMMATFVLRRIDSKFYGRAKEWGGGIIVAGQNYGQGSSREHAALAPKFLGVKAVIAKSIARIHRRNLIAQGIVPLIFENVHDYDELCQGQLVAIGDLRCSLESGEGECQAAVEDAGKSITLLTEFSTRERQVLLAGGLLAHIRSGGGGLSVNLGRSGAVDQGSPFVSEVPEA